MRSRGHGVRPRSHERRRSLTTVLLQKLEPSARLKDLREDQAAVSNQQQLVLERKIELLDHQRHAVSRWPQVRALFVAMTKALTNAASNMSPTKAVHDRSKSWVRDIARECERSFPKPEVSALQLEIAISHALNISLTVIPFVEVAAALRGVVLTFQDVPAAMVDYRRILCALSVLDKWRQGEVALLMHWCDFFTVFRDQVPVLLAKDLAPVLHTACNCEGDEVALEPYVRELHQIAAANGGVVAERTLRVYVDEHPTLRQILHDQCWKQLTDDMRLKYFQELYEQAHRRWHEEDMKARREYALNIWRQREPRQRMARWKLFTKYERMKATSIKHFRHLALTKGVERLLEQRERRQHARRQTVNARKHYCTTLLMWTFDAWQLFRLSILLLFVRAHNRQEMKVVREIRRQKMDEIRLRREHKMLVQIMAQWKEFVVRQLESRDAATRQVHLHQQVHEQRQILEESRLMEIEERISHAVEARERELAEEAVRRAFHEQTEKVYENRKLKKQEEERIRYKRERDAVIMADMERMWTDIEQRTCAEVRAATLAWYETPEGVQAVEAESTRIFERDPIAVQKQLFSNPESLALPGCVWQLKLEDYGGRYAKAFYLNMDTYEKIMCDELVLENCEDIAREVIIQHRIDEAKARVQARAAQVYRQKTEQDAAIKIQMLFKCRHALRATRSVIRSIFMKRVDAVTGDVVYFNIRRQEARRKPPKLIGSDEPLIPVESTTWIRRIDDDGNSYFMRLDNDETSWTPPDHYILCDRCHHNFVTRRWNEGGSRFCIICHAEGVKNGFFPEDATWTKLTVQPAKCVVCRNSLADVICHDCRGDSTCTRCFTALHRNKRIADHKQFEWLINRPAIGLTPPSSWPTSSPTSRAAS
ncbi:TPA: hypothetical protein N0F65_012837 [Lagenidium giganteum]|uniref:WW domain-containing protein n=1 Tax=Lagenidium giganteum TaxID=4803 RepID=A0AAV2YH66_9STRA|nr:TPA: hypothetical protein N0F65_012837 [Lagenidium giganteum]